jgi:hypothetical protein
MKNLMLYRSVFFILLSVISFIDCKKAATRNITPKKKIDITKALEYPIPHIIERYKKDYGVSDEAAKTHEKELKRYLILAAENSPKNVDMFSPTIDDLWHTFLLFTKDYEKYCKEMLGEFVHHVPKTHEKISAS